MSLQDSGWSLGGGEGGHWGLLERGDRRAMILESPAGGYAWAVSQGEHSLGDGFSEELDDAVTAALQILAA